MRLIAIDPGSMESGVVVYTHTEQKIIEHWKAPNEEVRLWLRRHIGDEALVIESVTVRGERLYQQLVDTIFWSGRFVEAWGGEFHLMSRRDVKAYLATVASKDSDIRAAVISRFPATGGGQTPAVGTKSSPGPLYGVVKDEWAALALAIAWSEKEMVFT